MKRMTTSLLLAAAVLLSGCSEPPPKVQCGGKVRFHQTNLAEADAILQAARRDSKNYCAESGGACDFFVSKEDDGWSVVALAVNTPAERCLYGIGYDRTYIYDTSGRLLRVHPGI
ncbi:hypothetical protein ACLB90_08740 [Stenotrophomonas sp. LGBM10]|uniref:hypothetical protein n=1 Tax=Stenotrophomonas sp. LGBM10 TaxID=3390038 RepID=UPI00398AB3FC